MQLHIYIIALLLTSLQFSVGVASLDVTTTETSIRKTDQADIESRVAIDSDTIIKVEKMLLNKLFGMSKRPIPSTDRSTNECPDSLLKLYKELENDELRESINLPKLGTNSANTIRSFTHKESKIDERFKHHHHFRFYFDVSSNIPENEALKAAELQIKCDPISDKMELYHKVLVYDIQRPGIRNKDKTSLILIDQKTVRINASNTISLDVMPAVSRWLQHPKENYGILVKVVFGQLNSPPARRHVRLRRSIDEKEDEWSTVQPFLMTFTDDSRHKQRVIREIKANNGRRALHQRNRKRSQGRQMCQRKSLYVDFQQIGWGDWIMAPTGYYAYYCHGICDLPFADHLNTTNHAVVQQTIHKFNADMAPNVCCIPTELKPITLLYKDEQGKFVLKSYPDMQALSCGCR